MSEVWKAIPGFEGEYEASDEGRVRSIDRRITQVNRWGTLTDRGMRGRVLSAAPGTNGYLAVALGLGNMRMVHRLVAQAHIRNPGNKPQVNHKDGNRANNAVSNLEWVTCSENHLHSYANLPRKKHGRSRPVVVAGVFAFEDQSEAAKFLGVAPGSVASAALRGHKCRGMEVAYA